MIVVYMYILNNSNKIAVLILLINIQIKSKKNQMNLNANTKPSKCPRCNLDFPEDKIRWPIYNINKHIQTCEDQYQEKEKIKNSNKALTNYLVS